MPVEAPRAWRLKGQFLRMEGRTSPNPGKMFGDRNMNPRPEVLTPEEKEYMEKLRRDFTKELKINKDVDYS